MPSVEGKALYSAETQAKNIQIILSFYKDHYSGDPGIWERYISPNCRIWYESKSTDPVASTWSETKVHIGWQAAKAIAEAYDNVGFTYDEVIHNIYACGSVVVVERTDTRKEEGQPDIYFPAVGVFAVQDGKIIEWSDYYR